MEIILVLFVLLQLASKHVSSKPWFYEATDLHEQVCDITLGAECSSEFVDVTSDDFNDMLEKPKCCGYCMCDDDCFIHGACCLKMYDDFISARRFTDNTRFSCVSPEFIAQKPVNYTKPRPVWMVTKCAVDGTNKDACETPDVQNPLYMQFPVTDSLTNVVYSNIFCAECNNVTIDVNIWSWTFKFKCDDVLDLHEGNLRSQMHTKNCSINFITPVDLPNPSYCIRVPYRISKCNETGLWPVYDEKIDLACNAFVDPFNLTYKNYFCYICNIDVPQPESDWQCSVVLEEFDLNIAPPFGALLDFNTLRRWENDEVLTCDEWTQFADYRLMRCRDVMCHKQRYLSKGKCLLNANRTESFCQEIWLKLSVVQSSVLLVAQLFDEQFFNEIQDRFSSLKTEAFGVFLEEESVDLNDSVVYFVVYMLIDSVEIELNDMKYLHGRATWVYIYGKYIDFSLSLFYVNITGTRFEMYGFSDGGLSNRGLHTVKLQTVKFPDCKQKLIIPFKKTQVCPFVRIHFDETTITIQNTSLYISENNIFPYWRYEEHGDQVSLCLDDYKEIYNEVGFRPGEKTLNVDVSVDARDALALALVCLSIICLLITIITYFLLSELHTQPGANNMILCVSLLLAQSVYQFGAGQQTLSKWPCAIIGAISHFLWLSVMFSMNVCSIKVFLAVIKVRRTSHGFSKSKTTMNILYVSLSSLGFVAANVTVSLAESGGQTIGYGGSICYMSSSLMHLITFLLPSAALLISNIVMFVIVIFRIHASTADLNLERSYLLVYARLSSLTGITWVLGFMQILIQTQILEYLFIIFNASQGVFIMVAFVLNRRVCSMCSRAKQN